MRSIARERNSGRDQVLIVGGSGRLGSLLRAAWANLHEGHLIWQSRRAGVCVDTVFDPLDDGETYRHAADGKAALFNLAGSVRGDANTLLCHSNLAVAALETARLSGVSHVFLTSSAAVYGAVGGPAREDGPTRPITDYGRAKWAMENAARVWRQSAGVDAPNVTCLRIGNVAGADQLLAIRDGAMRQLDICPDGHSPRRSYIGPVALASVLSALFDHARAGTALPFILNVALPGSVSMAALLAADGLAWQPRSVGAHVIADLRLDVSRLATLVDLPDGGNDARAIIADLRSVRGSVDEAAR